MRVEATAGGGMVTVVMNGAKQVQSLTIDPTVVSKDDVEMLQDMIIAALNDAQPQGGRTPQPVDVGPDGRAEDPRACRSLAACVRRALMLPEPLIRLVEQLQRLPGIGAKGAQRLAFHVLKTPREDADRLCEAIRDVKERVTYCSVCNNITDSRSLRLLHRPDARRAHDLRGGGAAERHRRGEDAGVQGRCITC